MESAYILLQCCTPSAAVFYLSEWRSMGRLCPECQWLSPQPHIHHKREILHLQISLQHQAREGCSSHIIALMMWSQSFLIFKRGWVSISCLLWRIEFQLHEIADVLSVPSGNNGAVSVASQALPWGSVQWSAAMQMEITGIELTQAIIACQTVTALP